MCGSTDGDRIGTTDAGIGSDGDIVGIGGGHIRIIANAGVIAPGAVIRQAKDKKITRSIRSRRPGIQAKKSYTLVALFGGESVVA